MGEGPGFGVCVWGGRAECQGLWGSAGTLHLAQGQGLVGGRSRGSPTGWGCGTRSTKAWGLKGHEGDGGFGAEPLRWVLGQTWGERAFLAKKIRLPLQLLFSSLLFSSLLFSSLLFSSLLFPLTRPQGANFSNVFHSFVLMLFMCRTSVLLLPPCCPTLDPPEPQVLSTHTQYSVFSTQYVATAISSRRILFQGKRFIDRESRQSWRRDLA